MTVVESQEELRASAQGAETTAAPRLSRVLTRGVSGKCPACGEGSLFRAYLKRRDACPCCGESFQGLDADDGPAWLTIMIVGHVIIPLLYILETRAALSYSLEAAMLVLVTIALVLFVLPFAKGLFIANLWWNERKSA